jgi:hypothetical protein
MWSFNFSNRRAAIQQLEEAASRLAAELEAILRAEPGIEFIPAVIE